MTIEWTLDAQDEFDTILAHIAATQSVSNAERVVARTMHTEKLMELYPKAGMYDPATDTYDLYVPKTRIRLTYEITETGVLVLVAWHTSRDPADKPTGR